MKKKLSLLYALIVIPVLFFGIKVNAATEATISGYGAQFSYKDAGYSDGSASNDTKNYIVSSRTSAYKNDNQTMIGWCITPNYKNPEKGQEYDNIHEVTNNDELKKALYYGQGSYYERIHGGLNFAEEVYKSRHNGQANDGAQLIMTHASAAKLFGSSGWAYGGNTTMQNDVNAYITGIKDKPVPANVKVYYSTGGASSTGSYQTIAFMEVMPINIKINKKSSDADKTSASGKYSLAGAVYQVYKDGNYTNTTEDKCQSKYAVSGKTLTTKENGDTDNLSVDFDQYYVKETKAPNGFKIDNTCHKCTVTQPGDTCTVTSTDEPETGSVTLVKTADKTDLLSDSSNYSLEGAVYEVYSDSGLTKKVGTLTTKEDGTTNTISGLAYGTYYAKETKAPKGFTINTGVLQVELSASNRTATFRAVDGAKTGSLTLKKVSANPSFTQGKDGYSLEGAVYTVYSDEALKNKIGTLTTNADGTTNTITGLAYGTYYAKETKAPKGFELDDKNVYKAVLSDSNPNGLFEATDKLKKGKLSLIKRTDVKTDRSLEGAVYEVYSDKELKNKVGTLTTDKDGNTNVLELDAGLYYVKEIKAPEGFNINDEVIEALVVSDQTQVLNGVDTLIPENPKTGVESYLVPTVIIVGSAAVGLKMLKRKEIFRQI